MTDKYAVFGNPIKHSKSPAIHARFARQCDQDLHYRAVGVALDGFEDAVRGFFASGGRGLNITLPFKEQAARLADTCSAGVQRAGAANTLSLREDGRIHADSTDGIGLVRDMVCNLGWRVAGRRVIILGAGGAARSIIEALLAERPASVWVVNRTPGRAADLVAAFAGLGDIRSGDYGSLAGEQCDLLINATSASLHGDLPPLAAGLLGDRSCCYDLAYGNEPTVFMRWAAAEAAWAVSDGLGMLVEQAAEAFYLWRGRRPNTRDVLDDLRQSLLRAS